MKRNLYTILFILITAMLVPALAQEPAVTISSQAELATFRDAVNSGETYSGKSVTLTTSFTVDAWTTGIDKFAGTFNGDGYVITMTNATASLFKTINAGGTVKNLGVKTTIVNKAGSTGGIVATNKGTIQQCYTEGAITGTNVGGYGGGIVGTNEGAIRDCYSTASITTNIGVGGIAQINKGTIERCYATGAITGGSNEGGGGIAGRGYTGSISNCIALNTSIEGDGSLGRIAGYIDSHTFATNYASPAIPASTGAWANIAANQKDGADLADDNFTGKGANEGAFTGWLATAWDFTDTDKLPTLQGFKADQPVKNTTRASVMPAPPITTIASAEDLATFRDAVNDDETYEGKTVKLTADITVSNWSAPIGEGSCFKGIFDGQGHVITLTGSACLFEKIGESVDKVGTVQNLGVKVTLTDEEEAMASIAGIADTNYGTIQNCYTEGTISNAYWGGGIVVFNYNHIQDCYSTASITEGNDGGGIVYANFGTTQRCYATGAVKGDLEYSISAGGIVGMNAVNSTVESCIALNTSTEGPEGYLGRIVGLNSGTLTANYASPLIAGTWSDKGADKINGADLTDANFIDTGSGASAFEGWLPAVWDFSEADKLPKLKTIGLTSNIVIAGQGTMPARADFLEKAIEISTAITYDNATHKGNDITILSGGIFTINTEEASIKKLTIMEGGQLVATQAFTYEELLAPRILGNKWIAYGSPIEMKAVTEASTTLYTMTGYATSAPADQTWLADTSETGTSSALTSPSLTAVEDNDLSVTFTSKAEGDTPLTFTADGTPPQGEALHTGLFLFCANPTLHNVTIPMAYILSDDGTRFELTKDAVVKPFQSYLVANEITTRSVTVFRSGVMPTGNEQIAGNGFRVWGNKGQLHLSTDSTSHVSIYTPSGQLLRAFTLTGEQTVTLGSGIYFVHNNNITYKVSL